MLKRNILLLLLPIALLLNLATTVIPSPDNAATDPELVNFSKLLIGDFNSSEQAAKDTSYFHITLSMTRIWEDKTDGIWLYVEQAMATKQDKPYRQRVYHLTHPSKEIFSSDIFMLSNAAEVVGLKNDPAKRALLTPDKITRKEGCTVYLSNKNGVYEGGTRGAECPSDLRGAKYATTKIRLTADRLESWDQGFDSTGTQVWGATKGGYIFIRQ
ncbi:MAG: chromophore lyase CpcT/CpeT [Bacteroidia bacterium]